MASQPGPLTHWPWQKLGNFKYGLLAPWVARSMYKLTRARSEGGEIDMLNLSILPTLLLRLLYSQLWITASRFHTARAKHRIVNRSLDFDQVDRERNWDDQIILTALLFFAGNEVIPGAAYLPWWDARGAVLAGLLHVGPVEFVYYWLHRALHHHFLYSRYHSHHHASIVTEPITSVIHPFAEELAYFVLFAIPLITMTVTGTGSIVAAVGYIAYVDFMNYLGHCNFELVPKWLFDALPPLKYLMYTPSFHSLHHTQFRTNYSLFMPFYDYVYGTVDKSSDELYERCRRGREEEAPAVVHLTHLTTLPSLCHLRLGFASLSSRPCGAGRCTWLAAPLGWAAAAALTWLRGATFAVERNRLRGLSAETWAVPRYSFQYKSSAGREEINEFIEKAIGEAEAKGAKVVSLGLMNQGDELNGNGGLYYRNNPRLKVRIVDGTGLAAAVVLDRVPRGARSVLLVGERCKVACVLAAALCMKGVEVTVARRDTYQALKLKLPRELAGYVVFSESYASQVWLVGDGLRDEEQAAAARGVHFIPFSQFPPRAARRDCFYHSTPALKAPKECENMHACENWLPRRVMSAWRAAGIVHALEGWDARECGEDAMDVERVWHAALDHGFSPFDDVQGNN